MAANPTVESAAIAEPLTGSSTQIDPVLAGTCFGIISALSYTAANMALRDLSVPNDVHWAIWMSAVKAMPAAFTAWVIIAVNFSRGLPALPPKRLFLKLLAAGLVMQGGGNVMFQWSLGMGGLALTVPLTFATLITSGAGFGHVYLKEQISRRSLMAMGVLILSIACLSVGAEAATTAVTQTTTSGTMLMAIIGASIAGVAYGIAGVIIRSAVTQSVPLSATLGCFSTMGLLGLGSFSLIRVGPTELFTRSADHFGMMLLAGIFNAMAFFAIGAALKRIPVVRANLLNASQIAMCSAAGVIWFREQLSIWLIIGSLLTITGLMTMDSRSKPTSNDEV